jgi:hypothetical protein
MNLAKQINQKLDEIISIRKEIKRMNHDLSDETSLKNIQTGESTNKAEALRVVEGMVDQIKDELNQITNDGQNVKDIFTNKYYINDTMQDREIAESN